MATNRYDVDDQYKGIADLKLSGSSACEHRTLTSGSIGQFSQSLERGWCYELACKGGDAVFTLDGTAPTMVAGSGASVGFFLLERTPKAFIVPDTYTSGCLKMLSTSTVDVWVHRTGETPYK